MIATDPTHTEQSISPWWQSAVIYQIYPRSFADANGDGVGDLAGITAHLEHLAWLGVDALWISPFYRSPMCDFGYDISDHCDVDPVFGSLGDFDRLLETAHAFGLRVIIDWVPAHTSSRHPWFEKARAARDDRYRDFYVWRDPGPAGELPNNWLSALTDGAPAWTLEPRTAQLYLHSFLPEQPDLNWANPAVARSMEDVLRFWLDRGVDGFRADVVHNIGKDPMLSDVKGPHARLPHCVLNDEPATHEHLRGIRRLLDAYPGERMMVGEVFLLSTEQVPAYYGQNDELHLCFNFPPLFAPWQAENWRQQLAQCAALFEPIGAWPTWVLSNHDQKRHRTRLGSEARARAAAVLLLTLRGTPFLYMGEELGLEDAVVPSHRAVDPGGRDGCRAPLPWLCGAPHGWPKEPWLPFPPDAEARSVESQRRDDSSVLHLYRRLLRCRSQSPALREGSLELLACPAGVLAYRRQSGDDERTVLLNFRDGPVSIEIGHGRRVVLASDGETEARVFDGTLGPSQALILR